MKIKAVIKRTHKREEMQGGRFPWKYFYEFTFGMMKIRNSALKKTSAINDFMELRWYRESFVLRA